MEDNLLRQKYKYYQYLPIAKQFWFRFFTYSGDMIKPYMTFSEYIKAEYRNIKHLHEA